MFTYILMNVPHSFPLHDRSPDRAKTQNKPFASLASSRFKFVCGFEVQAHDKEKEKMRNIEYIIACARSARTSPSPLSPLGLTEEMINYIIENIKKFAKTPLRQSGENYEV